MSNVKVNIQQDTVITQEALFQALFGQSTDSFIQELKLKQKKLEETG